MSEIRAIETHYKGHRFRSRLEARWAVFFDALDLDWRYEHQGYENDSGRYLPDFEIYGKNGSVIYVEVKGKPSAIAEDFQKYIGILDFNSCLPHFQDSLETDRAKWLLLGDIPHVEGVQTCFHPGYQHYKGLHRRWFCFVCRDYPVVPSHSTKDTYPVVAHLLEVEQDGCVEGDPEKWNVEYRVVDTRARFRGVADAYAKARAARFEYGERG